MCVGVSLHYEKNQKLQNFNFVKIQKNSKKSKFLEIQKN
jgi:hypothetical protein